ncbi:TPA: ead/Ea22-like family protein [Klebsiella pneumoniae]
MTTDITELAQSLKAAAEKATPGQWARGDGKHGGELLVYCDDALGSAVCEATSGYNAIPKYQRINNLDFIAMANPANVKRLVEALEKAQQFIARQGQIILNQDESLSIRRGELEFARRRIAELESRTVKLPDGWQFEECEIEGCENGAIFSVGTGSRNIHLCDKCAHEPQNSRLKKSPLSKRLPFKMSAGIKVEAE